ncbi:hypothetical protein EON77_08410 [bacterium]|nr:MAG: hypothetical protein EON77_08410 [bacterium]
MKIAVWWNLRPGGARRALHDHLRGLAERGHEIHVVRPPVVSPEWMGPDAFAASVQEVPLPEFHGSGRGYLGRAIAEIQRVRSVVPAMEAHCAEAGRRILDLRPDVLFGQTCWLMAAKNSSSRMPQMRPLA